MILGEIQFLDEITLLGTFFRDSKKVSFFFSRKSLLRMPIERKSLEKESFGFLSKKKKVSNCIPGYYIPYDIRYTYNIHM